MKDARCRRLLPALAIALALGLQGCGRSEPTGSVPVPAVPSLTTSEAPDPADAEAARAAGEFLTAIGDGQLLNAYRLLTRDAQSSLSYEQFAADRDYRQRTGRGLAFANVVSTSRQGDTVMVTAQGRRSGGIPVELVVATVQTPAGWRVTGVPVGI